MKKGKRIASPSTEVIIAKDVVFEKSKLKKSKNIHKIIHKIRKCRESVSIRCG